MNIYYPLIARTIDQLERNTAETRRAIYARARAALAAQFKDLGEELPQESQALEEAIKEIEASALGRAPDEPGTLRVVRGNKKGQGALGHLMRLPAPLQTVSKQPLCRVRPSPRMTERANPKMAGRPTRPEAKPMTVLQSILV